LVGVFCISKTFQPKLEFGFQTKVYIPKGIEVHDVGSKSRLLQLVRGERIFMSSMTRIRVYAWIGLGGKTFKLFYGLFIQLIIDLGL
jgi:predicted small integral membrane protein